MKLPDHLFVASDGDLFDTRKPGWNIHPIRKLYSCTFQRIQNTHQLRATLRTGPYAWPGGYQMYFITSDGAALSFETVRDNYDQVSWSIRNNCNDGWRVYAVDINYEDNELYDGHTNEKIPSAYGD